MRWLFVQFLLLLLMPTTGSALLIVEAADVGEIYQFQKTISEIRLSNDGAESIEIKEIVAMRANESVSPGYAKVVPPHTTVVVPVEIDAHNDVGLKLHSFRVVPVDAQIGVKMAQVKVFGLSIIDNANTELAFGIVRFNGGDAKPEAKSLTLTSRDASTWSIVRVVESPAFVKAELNNGTTLSVTPIESKTWGNMRGYIKLEVNSPHQKQVWIPVTADFRGAVVPDTNPFAFGVAREGQLNEYSIRLTDVTGKKLKLGTPVLSGFAGEVKLTDCVPSKKSCLLLRLRIDGAQSTGKLLGQIKLASKPHGSELVIDTWGLLLHHDAKVISLDEKLKNDAAAATAPTAGAQSAAPPRDFTKSLKLAVAGDTQPKTIEGTGPLLKWSVLHEDGIYGYGIFRSSTEDGPQERVNTQLIPISSIDGSGSSYQWRDNTARPGQAYWYQIATFYLTGEIRNLTGRARVKRD